MNRPEEHGSRASSLWILLAYRRFCQYIYGSGAIYYDSVSWLISFGQWNRWRCISLDFLPQGQVLELGHGTGGLQLELARSGHQTFGLEYSAEMTQLCREKCLAKGVETSKVRGDGQSLPFAPKVFDGIVATFPEQYIAGLECLKECRRVINDQGDSKMIIIGRWLELELPILKSIFPVFYRPLNGGEVAEFEQNAKTAGWDMQLVAVKSSFVCHHVIVLSPIKKDEE
jgi:ubiquinone/menaquinone biosynthesis C-methylase UbiE